MRQRLMVGVVLLAMAVAGTARAENKLAFVDIQRALNECRAGKQAKADFRVRIERLQGDLEKQQSAVEALKDELQKKGPLMQPEQRQNLEDEYSRKLRDFQDNYKNSRDELQQKDSEITGAIVRDLATVVRELGEKDGYTMVMEKGSLLWAIPSIDITDQVIRSYDAMNVKPGSLAHETGSAQPSHFSRGTRAPVAALPPPETGGRTTISK
jgi:outer membrane protein